MVIYICNLLSLKLCPVALNKRVHNLSMSPRGMHHLIKFHFSLLIKIKFFKTAMQIIIGLKLLFTVYENDGR